MNNLSASGSTPSSHDRWFDTEHLKDDLKGRSVRGGAITVMAQGGMFVLNLVAIMVLARLLEPEDFGLFGMILAILNCLQLFRDMGLSLATVQRDHVTHEQISTLFWCNVLLGLALTIIIVCVSPLIAWFYREPRLVSMTMVCALGFLAVSFGSQHCALMRRQMRFGALAVGQISGRLFGVLVGITAAWYGLGYWALVLMYISTLVVAAAMPWILFPWRPGKPVRGTGVRPMLAFGGYITGYRLLRKAAENIDKALIGRFFGGAALGHYTRAYAILTQPIQHALTPISSVAASTLSKLSNEPARFRQYYLKMIWLVTLVGAPIGAFCCGASDEIVLTMLGKQWDAVSPILFWFGVAATILATYECVRWLHITSGRSERLLRWGFVEFPVVLSALIIGMLYSVPAMAACYSGAIWLLFVPAFWYAGKPVGLSVADVVRQAGRPVLAAAASALICWSLGPRLLETESPVLGLLTKGGVFVVAYGLGLVCLYGSFEPFKVPINLLKDSRRRRPYKSDLEKQE